MTDFDHLIKEKAEQAQYKFRPSAWKSFLQYSGLKAGLAAWQIAAIITAAVVTGGAITYGVLKHSSVKNIEPEQYADQLVADTTEDEVIDMSEPIVEEISEPEHKAQTTPSTIQKSVKSTTDNPVVEEQPKAEQPKTTTVKRRYYGRPVVIDVDTITVMHPTDEELRKGNSRLF